ncbi:hypothetical protein PINS_up011793 [Pythium insidiosum]|nr:hypothetical protein PINS_up011793 [Pythium insidiosum]
MALDDMETSATISFHGVAYVVTVGVQKQTLEIQVEVDEQSSAVPSATLDYACWTAQFPAHAIEELTRKTGNFKRFPVFVNMLLSAISHRSDSVFIDLLTTADLENYRKRKLGNRARLDESWDSSGSTAPTNPNAANQHQQKRFLILTYAVEFDRVHFPLPLQRVLSPTPETLQRTIRRLRQALASQRSSTTDTDNHSGLDQLQVLREENRCLKATLQRYCCQDDDPDDENVDRSNRGGVDLQRELEASMQENKEILKIYQQLREDSGREIAKLKAEIKQLKQGRENRHDRQHLRDELEHERLETRRKLAESHAMAEDALLQLQQMKARLDEANLKNKELLRQLAIARASDIDDRLTALQEFLREAKQATATRSPNAVDV